MGFECSGGNVPIEVHGYSDSDWGGDKETRRSTSGYVFQMADGPTELMPADGFTKPFPPVNFTRFLDSIWLELRR